MKYRTLTIVLLLTFNFLAGQNMNYETDVLVYGATPSGTMVAITIKKSGYSVRLVEPGRWVGGILGAGLKLVQDMPNYEAVGGTTRKLMLHLGVGQMKNQAIKQR